MIRFCSEADDGTARCRDVAFFVPDVKLECDFVGVDGAGQVPGRTTADIYWTIIPTFDENNVAPNGTKYFIGASMTYKIGGKDEAVTV